MHTIKTMRKNKKMFGGGAPKRSTTKLPKNHKRGGESKLSKEVFEDFSRLVNDAWGESGDIIQLTIWKR